MLAAALFVYGAHLAAAQNGAGPAGYDQPWRPQVHFSPQQRWMNDPNGLVFFKGEYHLFFQYNPSGDVAANQSWGHAVSRDLLHWQQLGIAIPAIGDELVFTGSVVIDEGNTSGLCVGGRACMVAVYTANKGSGVTQRETQDLAVSQDRGRTWQRFSGNPVLDLHMTDFRDPSVTWNRLTRSWLMAVSLPNEHQVALYTSPNLRQWTRLSTFGPAGPTDGQWECPDLLEVPAQNGHGSLWAMKVGLNPGGLQGGSGEEYFLGDFDGKDFKVSEKAGAHRWTDYGKDSYCAISFNHLPANEKPTLIGWMDNWQYAQKLPTTPWRGQMTMPRRLSYLEDKDGLSLVEAPVIEPLRTPAHTLMNGTLLGEGAAPGTTPVTLPTPAELKVLFAGSDAGAMGLKLYSDNEHWIEVGFEKAHMRIYVDRTHASVIPEPMFPARTEAPIVPGRPLDLHLVLDRSSLEVFAQDGTIAMTNLLFPSGKSVRVVPFRSGGSQKVTMSGDAWELAPIWKASASH